MKRFIKCLMALGVSVAASAVLADATSIRLLHSTPVDLYQAVNQRFYADHQNIRLTSDPAAADYDALTRSLFLGAIGGGTPDITFQGYNLVGLTVERGIPVALDSFIRAEKNWSSEGYSPEVLRMCTSKGKVYGLPFATSVPIVFYNLDLVVKSGHNPQNLPSDWQGILSLARDIKSKAPEASSVFFDYANTSNWTFQALLGSFGGRLTTPDGGIGFNSAAGLKAVDLLAEFREAGQLDMSRAQAWQAFSAGRLGILVSSSSLLSQFEQQAAGTFKIGTAAFPMAVPGGRLPAGGNCAMITTNDPAKQRAAWDYIKFATGPVGQTIVAMKSGYVPVNAKAIADPKLLGTYYAQHPSYMTAVRQLPILDRPESFPGDNSLKITTVINDRLGSVILNRATPRAALDAMTADVQALLSKK